MSDTLTTDLQYIIGGRGVSDTLTTDLQYIIGGRVVVDTIRSLMARIFSVKQFPCMDNLKGEEGNNGIYL